MDQSRCGDEADSQALLTGCQPKAEANICSATWPVFAPPLTKGKSGRLLRRPQPDHPAATVDEFCTAVLNRLDELMPWNYSPEV